jgi:cytochrome c oxidase subunit 2
MWAFDPAELAIEPGSTVDLYLSTADVTHGMQIPGTNVNLMAVPGALNNVREKFDKPVEYMVVSNEYCGIKHHNMAGRIHVSEEAAAAAQAAAAAAALPKGQPSAGEALLDQYGCTACHSIDGSEMSAPTFKGLYHSSRALTDGTVLFVEDGYLFESIDKPGAKVVKGYEAMPEIPVKPEDIHKIVEYIETLR